MGYQIHLKAARFVIDAANVPAALKAINDLCFPPEVLKQYPQWRSYQTIEQAFEEDRWRIERDLGQVNRIYFEGEKGYREMGADEESVLWMVREQVRPGSFIQMWGEDGDRWTWVFDGKTVETKDGWVKPGDVGWVQQ